MPTGHSESNGEGKYSPWVALHLHDLDHCCLGPNFPSHRPRDPAKTCFVVVGVLKVVRLRDLLLEGLSLWGFHVSLVLAIGSTSLSGVGTGGHCTLWGGFGGTGNPESTRHCMQKSAQFTRLTSRHALKLRKPDLLGASRGDWRLRLDPPYTAGPPTPGPTKTPDPRTPGPLGPLGPPDPRTPRTPGPPKYIYIYINIYIYIYLYLYMYMYIYICMYMYVYVCIHVYIYIYIYMCVCICIYVCVCICMHASYYKIYI